jgi:hypothetical protein
MSKSKRNVLLLPMVVLVTGLSITSLIQSPQAAHSQQDYDEYLITETNNEQKLNQKNIGSGSSSNLNCGTDIVGSDSALTCPSNPGENPTPLPGTIVTPVVTQRVANVPTNPGVETTSGEAQCNPDEVVTGGGYDIPRSILRPLPNTIVLKEFAADNSWHVEVSDAGVLGSIKVYAECLKLVPG